MGPPKLDLQHSSSNFGMWVLGGWSSQPCHSFGLWSCVSSVVHTDFSLCPFLAAAASDEGAPGGTSRASQRLHERAQGELVSKGVSSNQHFGRKHGLLGGLRRGPAMGPPKLDLQHSIGF